MCVDHEKVRHQLGRIKALLATAQRIQRVLQAGDIRQVRPLIATQPPCGVSLRSAATVKVRLVMSKPFPVKQRVPRKYTGNTATKMKMRQPGCRTTACKEHAVWNTAILACIELPHWQHVKSTFVGVMFKSYTVPVVEMLLRGTHVPPVYTIVMMMILQTDSIIHTSATRSFGGIANHPPRAQDIFDDGSYLHASFFEAAESTIRAFS